MSKQSTIQRANAEGRRQRRQTRKQRGKREINWPLSVMGPQIQASRSNHLFVGIKRLRATIALLRRNRLRHHITAFLKGGMNVVIFINPFSPSERKDWDEVRLLAGQR